MIVHDRHTYLDIDIQKGMKYYNTKMIGPGLLESVYHRCLLQELDLRGINYTSQLVVPVRYKGIAFGTPLKCDLFVEDILPVELKSVDCILPIHKAQLLTYMSLLSAPKGLLLNFNVTNLFKEGQFTMVNDYYRDLLD
jgi:GxxExxY protein